MESKKRFISIKTKIIASTLIPVAISFFVLSTVLFIYLFNSYDEIAEAEFFQIAQKHSVSFEGKINSAMNYLSIVTSTLELQIESGAVDRETIQKTILRIFDDYKLLDGSSVYFEPNMYDGKDSEYVGTDYGTALSGRICYYFYTDEGKTAYLPEGLENDIEFTLPHYTLAKEANEPIYTEPTAHLIDGRVIPMFTLTYPINNSKNEFIGAVTVDLFLEDLYAQLISEQIYDTGYIIITNDNGRVIHSPFYDDIGKDRTKAGLDCEIPKDGNPVVYTNATSIINGKESFLTISPIYISALDSYFYISVVAPTEEISANGYRLLIVLATLSVIAFMAITLLLYYLINRISKPIADITESANRIANGEIDRTSSFTLDEKNVKTIDEVNILFNALEKMLMQLNGIQELKLEALELIHKKEKAEEAAKAKNDFLAKMSHEIRTPMNAVMGMSELILRKELPQDVYENALGIKSASLNLLSIINDILDFSKIESGMLEIVETDYLLPSLINDVINVIRIRLVDKPIQFIVNVSPDMPISLTGDEIRVRQILVNLLSNAVKYTNEGYISLDVTAEVKDNSAKLILIISDSGVGIKDGDIGKLFGDFVQVDTTTNKGVEGTGLGLAISRNLCRMMGGDITVRSEYGKGSVFTVTLPQTVKEYMPFAFVENKESKSVLLYETRTVYRDSVASALESLGVTFKSVESIPALFDNLEKYPYAFVSSFMYGSVNPALEKLENPPKLVLLTDITELISPKDARVLALPAHSLSFANVLNDIYMDYGTTATGASFIAPDARVLIVDDVTANLKVAEGLLLPYEMQVTLCQSGREAIRLITDKKYDLVFMDHMMPGMDGIEATGHIRAVGNEYTSSLPIVALTANAVSGVREMFIQNGMNDFLAKPIETAKLNAILEKWIPKEKQMKVKKAKAEKNEEKNDFVEMLKTVPDFSVEKALLVVGGSKETYEKIVKLSVRLLPENIAKLNNLIETDLQTYAIEVHGVKSVMNNMGVYELGFEALELEDLSKGGNLEACKIKHPILINKLTRFYKTMSELMAKSTKPAKSTGDKSLLINVITELKEAADYYDSAKALEVLSSVSENTFGQNVDIILDELSQAFEHFDFDSVLVLIDKLELEIN